MSSTSLLKISNHAVLPRSPEVGVTEYSVRTTRKRRRVPAINPGHREFRTNCTPHEALLPQPLRIQVMSSKVEYHKGCSPRAS